MKFFDNLTNVHLLDDVRKDAVSRAKDYIDISLIVCILDYVETVSRKNVEGLLQEIAGYPRDIPLFDITIKGMEYILAGMSADELVEVLTKDYWENPVKDSFAFDKYMGILEVLLIKEGFSVARVQQIMLRELLWRNQEVWREEEWIIYDEQLCRMV